MATWTSSNDVFEAWIGDDSPDDPAQVQTWIEKAEREIRFRVPDIRARLLAESLLVPPSTDLLETAKDVVVAMVTRVFRNPEGIRQRNSTTGPFTESATYGGDTPGGLSLTSDEIAKLQGIRDTGAAFAVDLMPVTSRFSPSYVAPPWWVTDGYV